MYLSSTELFEKYISNRSVGLFAVIAFCTKGFILIIALCILYCLIEYKTYKPLDSELSCLLEETKVSVAIQLLVLWKLILRPIH